MFHLTLLNLSVLLLFSCNKLIINCVSNDKHKDCTHSRYYFACLSLLVWTLLWLDWSLSINLNNFLSVQYISENQFGFDAQFIFPQQETVCVLHLIHKTQRDGTKGRAGHLLIRRLVVQSPSAPVCMPKILEQDTNSKLLFDGWIRRTMNVCEW